MQKENLAVFQNTVRENRIIPYSVEMSRERFPTLIYDFMANHRRRPSEIKKNLTKVMGLSRHVKKSVNAYVANLKNKHEMDFLGCAMPKKKGTKIYIANQYAILSREGDVVTVNIWNGNKQFQYEIAYHIHPINPKHPVGKYTK